MWRVIIIGLSAFFALILKIPAFFSFIKTNLLARKHARMTGRLRELEIEKQQNEDRKTLDEKVKKADKSDMYKHFGSDSF